MSDSSTPRGDGPAVPAASDIRQAMLSQRKDLSAATVEQHSGAVARHLVALAAVTGARTVGAYAALGGEVDPAPALALLAAVPYLPVIGPDSSMEFRLSSPEYPSIANRYGIAEPPASAPSIEPAELDVVLVPLVAFDATGARIGMGAGYYDRHFAFRQRAGGPPLLVGVAHGFQEVPSIEPHPWDVALDLVVTEAGQRVEKSVADTPFSPGDGQQ